MRNYEPREAANPRIQYEDQRDNPANWPDGAPWRKDSPEDCLDDSAPTSKTYLRSRASEPGRGLVILNGPRNPFKVPTADGVQAFVALVEQQGQNRQGHSGIEEVTAEIPLRTPAANQWHQVLPKV